MVEGSRLPGWVVPGRFEVSDVSCLALRGVVENRSRRACAGMVAALGWVHGVLSGPVTGRDESPVSWETATAELWAAASTRPDWPSPPLRQVCETLAVRCWPPASVDADFALGVCATLRWLTGADEQPPLPIPVRNAAGTPATQFEVYTELLAAREAAGGRVGPGEVVELVAEAARVAARSRDLAALVAETATRAHS
jgi:hypothetical protein